MNHYRIEQDFIPCGVLLDNLRDSTLYYQRLSVTDASKEAATNITISATLISVNAQVRVKDN